MKRYQLTTLLLLWVTISLLLLSACGPDETAGGADPGPEDAAAAVRDYLLAQGAPVDKMDIQVKQSDGDFARVEVISVDPESPGGFNAFVGRQNGSWTTLIAGSGMEREHVEALGIPQNVWPENWLIPDNPPEEPTASVCPEPTTAENLLYTDDVLGFCLLYPASHTVLQLESGNTEMVVGDLMNHTDPRISITGEDLAGRSLAQVVDDFLSGYEGFEIARSELTIDGQQAVLLDGIPGQDYYRNLFIAHDGQLLRLSFFPYDPNLESLAQAEQLYALAIDSFRFTTP